MIGISVSCESHLLWTMYCLWDAGDKLDLQLSVLEVDVLFCHGDISGLVFLVHGAASQTCVSHFWVSTDLVSLADLI